MTATTKALTAALFVPVLLLANGCFGGTSTPGAIALRIAFGPDDGSPGLVVFHLSCNPPSGALPGASAACAAVRNQPRLTSPPPSTISCGGVAGAWAVSIMGAVDGNPVHVRFGVCDQQVTEWMQILRYTPCPASFMEFTCSHGPYAFGRAHMRDMYQVVPNVVGKTASQATRILRQHGLRARFTTPLLHHLKRVVAAESPRAGTAADVYQVIKLTLNKGCGFC